MTYFEKFLTANNLKKGDIAIYLGVSNSCVSNWVKGKKIAHDKLTKLLNNADWDISALAAYQAAQMRDAKNPGTTNEKIAQLIEQQERLLQYLDGQNRLMQTVIANQTISINILQEFVKRITDKDEKGKKK